MLAAPALINRSMTNYWAGVSGEGKRIIPRWPNKKRTFWFRTLKMMPIELQWSNFDFEKKSKL
jgi:hypothetical protein